MDLRIIKTHKAIRYAFIELLSEQNYDDITIQDILDKALVNRATFYKYYTGKSDLAGQMIDEFRQQVEKILSDRLNIDDKSLEMRMHCHGQRMFELRKQMLALWKIRTKRHNLYQDMFDMSKQNFIELAKQQNKTNNTIHNLDYQATMMATLMMASIQYYFERDQPFPKNFHDDWENMIHIVKI
ncbi:TetR/AcrR family transcriptional regulator [Moraxella boevrei]|uniref:TetR/AcrR family transcriptional regulator n=1 Tax=Faucicola boevrei TaxID=346665 RepID=UPI003736B1E9